MVKKTQIYKAVTDFDAKSEYPSLMVQVRIGHIQTKETSIVQLCHQLYDVPLIEDVLGMLENRLMNN